MCYERMAGLVIGDNPALMVSEARRLSRRPCDCPVDGFQEDIHRDCVRVSPRTEDGCLVHDIGQVGPGQASCSGG